MRLRRAVMVLVAVALCVLGSFAAAAQKAAVGFAGVAYTGADAEIATRLPNVSAVIGRSGQVAYRNRLIGAFAKHTPRHFEFLPDSHLQALDGSGSAVVMAIAFDRETISVERIDGQWKGLFEIAAQALFFDFREKQVLFSYPLTLQFVEIYSQEPNSAQLGALAERLLVTEGPASLLTVAPRELADLQLPNASSRRLQVAGVVVSELAQGKLPEKQRDGALVGHEFTKVFASTLRLAMLPYATGQVVDGTMSGRFADGAAFRLRIPEADYRITIALEDFREKTLSESAGFRQQLYGAFFKVRVEEPLSARAYFDQPLRQGSSKAIPASQDIVDSAAAYYETMLAGFGSFAQAVQGGAKPWVSEQPGGRALDQQLKSLKELIKQCR